MQIITITGRLGKDAEQKRTQGCDDVTSFSVAVDQGYGQNKTSNWFRVSLWGKRGSALSPYLLKGAQVTVAGELTIGEYQGKPQFDVRAHDVALQGARQGDGNRAQEPRPGAHGGDDLDSDIPF